MSLKVMFLSILATGILVLSGCGEAAPAPPDTYTLSTSVSPSGAGSVSPANGEYEEGTEVTVTADPASGHTFEYWGGDASGSLTTTTIIMGSDKSVTAHFAIEDDEDDETPSPPAITQEDVDAARQAILDYWDARNSYDVELILTFYEESFRLEREEEVRQQISQTQMAGMKIVAEEEAEPVITDEGTIEIRMKLNLPWPLGDEHVIYYMMKVNGEWKIYA